MYCLPGNENKPGKDSCAIEGRHYFSTLVELRKHLCAYGIPKCKKYLAYADVIAISRWVRFANVKGLPDAAFVNPADVGGYLSFRGAWSMLQKLGLTWSSGFYIVDDADLKLGTQTGTTNYETASQYLDEDRINAFEQFPFAVQALLAGDIDAVIMDETAGQGYMGENADGLKLVGDSLSSDQLGFIYPKGSDLVGPVDAALEELMSNGFLVLAELA